MTEKGKKERNRGYTLILRTCGMWSWAGPVAPAARGGTGDVVGVHREYAFDPRRRLPPKAVSTYPRARGLSLLQAGPTGRPSYYLPLKTEEGQGRPAEQGAGALPGDPVRPRRRPAHHRLRGIEPNPTRGLTLAGEGRAISGFDAGGRCFGDDWVRQDRLGEERRTCEECWRRSWRCSGAKRGKGGLPTTRI